MKVKVKASRVQFICIHWLHTPDIREYAMCTFVHTYDYLELVELYFM